MKALLRKKMIILTAVTLIMFVMIPWAHAAQKVKIGIIHILVNKDHEVLREYLLKGLKDNNYDVEYTVFDADAINYPDTYMQRGAEAAKKMVADGAQLIYATSMYLAVKDVVGNIPVIDPSHFVIPATAANYQERDGKIYCKGNATGTLLTYPFKEVVDFIMATVPNVQKIAYLYNPKSPVSRPVEDIQTLAQQEGLNVVPCPFTNKQEAIQALQKANAETGAAFATNDIYVVGAHEDAVQLGVNEKYPILFGIVPLVKAGALASFQLNWARAGEMCAQKADMIFKGTKPNTLPIEKSDMVEIGLNLKTAEKLGITEIPYELMEMATLRVE